MRFHSTQRACRKLAFRTIWPGVSPIFQVFLLFPRQTAGVYLEVRLRRGWLHYRSREFFAPDRPCGDCPQSHHSLHKCLTILCTSDVSVAPALAVQARTHFRATVLCGDSSIWISTPARISERQCCIKIVIACCEEFGPARPFKV